MDVKSTFYSQCNFDVNTIFTLYLLQCQFDVNIISMSVKVKSNVSQSKFVMSLSNLLFHFMNEKYMKIHPLLSA